MKKELFPDGVLELNLKDKQIGELIEGLKLLREGEEHIHFSIDKDNQLLLKKK
jgi:hypothetical protein